MIINLKIKVKPFKSMLLALPSNPSKYPEILFRNPPSKERN